MMIPIQEDLVKSVASKINYYIDVKQREDGFNLSASPYRHRKPLYIPVPPQRPRPYGSSSIKRNRLSLTLQEQPSILIKRRQRPQNLSSYIPFVFGNPKQEKIVQTASKFLVSLGFGNNYSHRYKKQRNAENKNSNKLPSINDKKIYQDFIYDDTASDYGKMSPDPSPSTVDPTEPLTEPSTEPPKSSTPTLTPKEEEVTPIPSISYSAEPVTETFGVLMHCATQTDFDSILIERKLPTNVDQEYAEIKSGKETKYVVVVKTGNVLGASTRAQVKIILCGTEGKTGVITLLKSETNKIKFQKGKEDHFILDTFSVGQLEKIRIGHDRPELPYAWFLDYVTIYDQTEKWIYKFPCSQWFTGEDGDKKTYRELIVEQNMPMVEDIQNINEEALLLWLARTESQDKNKEKDLHQEIATDKIQDESEHATLDTSRSDETSLSSDSSNLDRFTQGTVISVQNQVTTGTQTNKIASKGYNITRDFHRSQSNSPTSESKRSDNHSENESASSKEKSLKDDDKQEEQDKEKNSNSNGNKNEKKQNDTQNSSESVSSKENFY